MKWPRLGLLALILLLCCLILPACSTPVPDEDVFTEQIYSNLNFELPFVTGVYQWASPVMDVSQYSQIRVNTFGNSGSGTISVTIVSTDAAGENMGVIDFLTLDFSATYYLSGVYDVPGLYIKVYYQSQNPSYASLIIYGRP